MQVRFYGVRGSIPTPGPATVRYGGNSVCVEVRLADGTCIVLDSGTGLRELGKALIAERYHQPIHMFITHGHWDHIMGLPFFGPTHAADTRTFDRSLAGSLSRMSAPAFKQTIALLSGRLLQPTL